MLHPFPGELEFDGSNPSYCLNILPRTLVVFFLSPVFMGH